MPHPAVFTQNVQCVRLAAGRHECNTSVLIRLTFHKVV